MAQVLHQFPSVPLAICAEVRGEENHGTCDENRGKHLQTCDGKQKTSDGLKVMKKNIPPEVKKASLSSFWADFEVSRYLRHFWKPS